MIFHPFSVSGPDGKLQVDFLDVGQGDSALVTFPNGTTMLIDAGGKLNFRNDADEGEQPFEPDVQGIGELVVSQVLWAKGHSSVDYLVATHPDLDHIEGFTDIAANFDVGEILVERRASESPDFVEVAAAARRRNVPIRFVSEGTVMHIDGATVEVLSPGEGHTWLTSDNDRSLVIKITYGERSFLFTGDIESAAETRLAVPRADVVKAAHHGSRTSSTPSFVDAVSAEVVVVPAPRRSRFGHPHPEVVERWRASGAAVFMTGTSGMISVSTDGKGLSVKEFVKNKR
jgi:competence protein ComEC